MVSRNQYIHVVMVCVFLALVARPVYREFISFFRVIMGLDEDDQKEEDPYYWN